MRLAIVIPSIRKFKYWNQYEEQLKALREQGIECVVYVCGEEENESGIEDCIFLNKASYFISPILSIRKVDYAYKRIYNEVDGKFDFVFTIDDDTSPAKDFFTQHIEKVSSPVAVSDSYTNVIQNRFPRGFPFANRELKRVILNQGLWIGDGDYFACEQFPVTFPCQGVADVGKGITISSMNICFIPEIIPAFYQIPFRRFDDIWSGLILKRITDHLGDAITFGEPVVVHEKAPRDAMRDVKQEARGFTINEKLWDTLKNIQLTKTAYNTCYKQIATALDTHWEYSNNMRYYLRWLNDKPN